LRPGPMQLEPRRLARLLARPRDQCQLDVLARQPGHRKLVGSTRRRGPLTQGERNRFQRPTIKQNFDALNRLSRWNAQLIGDLERVAQKSMGLAISKIERTDHRWQLGGEYLILLNLPCSELGLLDRLLLIKRLQHHPCNVGPVELIAKARDREEVGRLLPAAV